MDLFSVRNLNDPLLSKSYQLSLSISMKVLSIKDTKKEFHLTSQLLRSATSITANIMESKAGQSNADFYSKISIAHKEAYETSFWIRLFKDLNFIDDVFYKESSSLLDEITRMLGKSRNTSKKFVAFQ